MTTAPLPDVPATVAHVVGPRRGSSPAWGAPGRSNGRTASADPRVRAAARVLAGEDPQTVAESTGTSAEQVLRWARGLSQGGSDAVGGVGLSRPGVTATTHVAVHAPVEEYLWVVAHELRTPLTAARAGLSVLARENLDAGVRAHTADMVRSRLDDLEQLASDVADAVAVSTGHTPLTPSTIDLGEVLSEACRLVGVPAPSTAGPLPVFADPGRVCQMVSRLLAHAQRYRGAGAVTAAVQDVPDGVLLTLRCDGVSLSSDAATEMLEPFGAAGRGDGNGLALYVVRTLAVASGGQLGVAGSAQGAPASTVFWLLLPHS